MWTTKSSRPLYLASLVLLVLLIAATPALSWSGGWGKHPSDSAGPSHHWGAGYDGPAAFGGCHGPAGRPNAVVNTYNGNLTITDLPVYYFGVGDALPFMLNYNSQAGRLTSYDPVMGHWSHSYDLKIRDDAPNGVTLFEANGWEHSYAGSPTPAAPAYSSPAGVYDKLERLYSGTTPIGWRLTRADHHVMQFDAAGKLTGLSDKDGLSWTLAYTQYMGYDLLSTVTDPLGRVTTFQWLGGQLIGVSGPGGVAGIGYALITIGTDQSGNPVQISVISSISDAAGQIYTITYHDYTAALVSSIGTGVAYHINFTYGTFDSRSVVATEQLQGVPSSLTTFSYSDVSGQRICAIGDTKAGQARVTRHVYDKGTGSTLGALLQVVQDYGDASHLNLTQSWVYDSQLRVTSYRDSYQAEPGGKDHIHRYYYAHATYPWLVTKYIDPESYSSSQGSNSPSYRFEYDNNATNGPGNLTKLTTPENRSTEIAYVSGTYRPSTATVHDAELNGTPVDRVTQFTYYGASKGYQVQTITDGRGNITTLDYNPQRGTIETLTLPGSRIWRFQSNTAGDITSVQDPNGNITSFTWDGLHKPLQTYYPDVGAGQKLTTIARNCCGLTSFTDENGIITQQQYHAASQRSTVLIEDSGSGSYTTHQYYDEVGNVTSVVDARGKTTYYTYDAADRLKRVDYPGGIYETWTYRDDGRILTHTDARGRTTTYRYNANDELWGPAGSGYAAANFANDTDVNITRDKDGLVTAFTDASGTSSLVYYPSGWLKTATNGAGKTVTYQYNGVGLVSALTTPGGLGFTFAYNALNLPETITNPNGVSVSLTYDGAGRLSRITRPGSYIDYQYNARNWITAVLNRTTGGVTRYDARYYYQDGSLWDHTGNPLKRVENFGGSDYTTTLRYDRLYRQTEETKRDSGGAVQYSLSYGYDAVGNRTAHTVGGVSYTSVFDDNDRLSSISIAGGSQVAGFGYDSNGNMTSVSGALFGPKTMVYDDSDELTSLTSGGVTDLYYYNASGQRYRARRSGTYQRYVYNGSRLLEEADDSGSVLSRFTTADPSYYSPLLHMWRSASVSRFPLSDLTGTAREEVDASGAVTDTYTLDTFGRQISSTGSTINPHRYGAAWGYLTDPSGFEQLGARTYWPELGRFLQQDPAGEGANAYSYAGGNPVVAADPDGEVVHDVADAIILGVDLGEFIAHPTWGGGAWLAVDAICALPVIPNVPGYIRAGARAGKMAASAGKAAKAGGRVARGTKYGKPAVCAAKKARTAATGTKGTVHGHHMLQKKFEKAFAAAYERSKGTLKGFDLDDYLTPVDADFHLGKIHGKAVDWQGQWQRFLAKYPEPTWYMVLTQAAKMRKRGGF